MNQIARPKVLEVMAMGSHQANIHLDVNGGIRVSKITKKGDLWDNIKDKTAMLNQKIKYDFSYELYITTLEKGMQKSLPDYKITIKEKQINPQIERLYGKYLDKKNHISCSQ